jgi:hypothetical protein
MQVSKHHTSDCTNFVLVQERVAYYNYRHSGIDETNILSQSSRGRDKYICTDRYVLTYSVRKKSIL